MSASAPPGEQVSTPQDWRKDITQQYRSSEVSNIAKVLASLDSSTSSASKMMLASRFEDTCFKNATSLAEYRKMIVKRLKNLQKNYVPVTQTAPMEASTAADNKNKLPTAAESLQAAQQIQIVLQQKFGKDLTCIHQYSNKAILNTLAKYGQERAFQLQQHVNNALQWAVDLAILDDGTTFAITQVHVNEQATHPIPIPIKSKVPWIHSYSAGDPNAALTYLQQVEKHLSLRISNIKSHVLKNANIDLFMEETLAGVEADLYKFASPVLRQALPTISQSNMKEIQKYMDLASVIVPIPRNKSEEKEAGIRYLRKIEACSQVFMLYTAYSFQDDSTKDHGNYLQRAYSIAIESCDALAKLSQSTTSTVPKDTLSLEDAWEKVMIYNKATTTSTITTMTTSATPEDTILDAVDVDMDANPRKTKRFKLDESGYCGSYPKVIRAKMLAKPGRRLFPPFIHALELKEATIENPTDGHGVARIKTSFGKVFDMYIYFSPLSVAIRATESNDKLGQTSLPPLSQGLRKYLDSTTATTKPLQVMGVQGDPSSIAHLVEKKLEYASAQATCVLRQVFSDELSKMTSNLSDGDLEILEGSAMIKFLQMARTTYLNLNE